MHQHPRPAPRSASAASNRATNPERTNNPRERPPHRTRSSVDLSSYTERASQEPAAGGGRQDLGDDREATKLNQIIQHFHTKAALTVCSSRANLPQVYNRNGEIKQNRWFNTVLDETDVLVDDLLPWRRPDLAESKPPPLVIEVYLDTLHLTHNQALVIHDEAGNRSDVALALDASSNSSTKPSRNGGRYCEVMLERWNIELADSDDYSQSELNDPLPNVYKKGVVIFRALYSFSRFLPAWKLHKKLTRQPGSHQSLRLRFRIKQGDDSVLPGSRRDSLYMPLCAADQQAEKVADRYRIPSLLCPAGPLSIAVDYRINCDFGVADREALLSTRFLGLDEGLPNMPAVPAGRSLPGVRTEQKRTKYSSSVAAPVAEQRARVGAYGSLGTFHAADRRGSPVTELRQRTLEAESDDNDNDNVDKSGKEASQRIDLARRPSINLVNNPPFKSGSLASSPRAPASPSSSAARLESNFSKVASTSSGKRLSLNTLPQQALRTPSIPNETAIASSGSSSSKPTPMQRYSSSFAGRNKRWTPKDKSGDSNGSSSSGAKWGGYRDDELNQVRGSYYEARPPSPHAYRSAEDAEIASFIGDLERAKDLPSLRSRPGSRGGDKTVNLTKYSIMRDPNTQLAEEMSASSLIQTSSTPPSRRLSNVPGLSTSSSPSRPLAHTPHVPSRLSTHSIAEETTGASGTSGASAEGSASPQIREEDEEDEEPFIFQQDTV